MNIKITTDEILRAIASAAPADGQPWEQKAIAERLSDYVAAEVREAQEAHRSWEEGRTEWRVRFSESSARYGNADAIASMQADHVARHRQLVAEKVAQNRALLSAVSTFIIGAVGSYAAGTLSPATLLPAVMGIAGQIADAINSE